MARPILCVLYRTTACAAPSQIVFEGCSRPRYYSVQTGEHALLHLHTYG